MCEKIAVLLTVHNRKSNTLQCLGNLFKSIGCLERYACSVYLVDDGSTDGTKDAVRELYPTVNIICAGGELFWNRGMNLAWKHAALEDPDYYLWLNDDTDLYVDSLNELLKVSVACGPFAIVVGTTVEKEDAFCYTYGGRLKDGSLIEPNGEIQDCHHFNGNCVLIPKAVFLKLGALDSYYRHSFGDFDYGYRAHKVSVRSVVSPNAVGVCSAHDSLPNWCDPSVPLMKRWENLYSPLGCHPMEVYHFDKNRGASALGIAHIVSVHLRMFFPQAWRKGKK